MLNSTCWKSSGSLLTSVLVLCLAGCGGTKLLDKPVPMTVGQPLASAADRQISVAVDWIVVRDGPGTWARNADWDEYLIRVQNLSNTQVEIRDVVIYDSMLIRSDSSGERRMLVAGSKQVARRYADHDIDVRAGLSGSTLLAAGAVGGAAAVGAGSAVLYMSSAAAATTLGVLLAAPALVAGGVVKSINQGRVDDEIMRRQASLPLTLESGKTLGMDLFFPLTPSPRRIEVLYRVPGSSDAYTLDVDTSAVLDGLHLSAE